MASIVEPPCCLVPPLPDCYISARDEERTIEARYPVSSKVGFGLEPSIFELPCCPPAPLPGFYISAKEAEETVESRASSQRWTLGGVIELSTVLLLTFPGCQKNKERVKARKVYQEICFLNDKDKQIKASK